jgi:hypothetical protein
MKTKEFESIIKKWIDAFHEHDIDGLMALYHDNAKHYSPKLEEEKPETKGWLEGKENLRAWWQTSFDQMPELDYKLLSISVNPSEAESYIKYKRTVPDEPTKLVMEYFIIKNGLIIESRVLRSWIIKE